MTSIGNDYTTTGGGTRSTEPYVPPASAMAQLNEKDTIAAAIEKQLLAGAGTGDNPLVIPEAKTARSGGGVTPQVCLPNPPGCPTTPPATYELSPFTDHKEGADDNCTAGTTGCSSIGHKYYTCSAASTRNMTHAMTGVDKGELHFENGLGLSKSQGLLGINRIPNLLNSEYSAWGSWKVTTPTSASNYASYIVTDTWNYNQGVIQNVKSDLLTYWDGPSLAHYNVVYGYRTATTKVMVAEEWNPAWTFGTLPSTYGDNPYGKRSQVNRGDANRQSTSPPTVPTSRDDSPTSSHARRGHAAVRGRDGVFGLDGCLPRCW